MTNPLIAITTDEKLIDAYTWHATIDTYSRAVSDVAGGIPVLVPSLGDAIAIDDLLQRVDGVLATGSRSNVQPERYGAAETEKTGPHDRARDATTLPLILAAIDKGVPLLAICRGIQELNVALGGTLISEIQECEGRMDHRAPSEAENDVRFAIKHRVTTIKGGRLRRILDAPTADVNSVHRQAVGRLADRLEIEAEAEDGTIEAVSVRDAPGFALGVQWHPEYWANTDTPSRAIFEAFGDAARARAFGEKRAAAE